MRTLPGLNWLLPLLVVLAVAVGAVTVPSALAAAQTPVVGQAPPSEQQVREQVAANPRDPSGYLTLANIYIAQGRLTEAEQMIRNALALTRDLAAQQAPAVDVDPDASGDAPLRIGGEIAEPRKIRDVRPVYPADARAAGVSGLVILEAVVGRDGRVQDARVLRSVPMLDDAALEAVRQWEYTPTLLNGVPVEVIMTLTVNFTSGT